MRLDLSPFRPQKFSARDADADITPAERAKCKKRGIDPNVYLATRAGIRARTGAQQ